ncbi:MAG: hypothetical protein AAFY56_14675, partial [Pseudomonadota bacterium]
MQITASVNYHIKSNEPQAFRFDVDGIVGNLVSPVLIPTKIKVQDLRGNTCTCDFDADGIIFTGYATRVVDFESSSNWKATYND